MIDQINIAFILIKIFGLSLAVEAITEIITTSDIMAPMRESIRKLAYTIPPEENGTTKLFSWVDRLISCGYCTSVWVSAFTSIWDPVELTGYRFVDALLMIFLIHRVANWLHVIYELIRKGRVSSVDLALKIEDQDGTDGKGYAEG